MQLFNGYPICSSLAVQVASVFLMAESISSIREEPVACFCVKQTFGLQLLH